MLGLDLIKFGGAILRYLASIFFEEKTCENK